MDFVCESLDEMQRAREAPEKETYHTCIGKMQVSFDVREDVAKNSVPILENARCRGGG